jgi:hypothetical protein
MSTGRGHRIKVIALATYRMDGADNLKRHALCIRKGCAPFRLQLMQDIKRPLPA